MIKHQGKISEALQNIKKIPNVVATLFPQAQNKKGILEKATYTLKNNYATKNDVTDGSSHILADFKPGYNATIVDKLDQAGAALLAKVHLDELALGGTGLHSAFGPITNPHNTKRIIGGSSSGSAASLISGVTFSIGSDTGDSVRNPASFIGKVGFKPSYGAISRYGLFAFATSLDTVGYLTHNVTDVINVSQVLYGIDPQDMTSRDIAKPIMKKQKPFQIAILKNVMALFPLAYQKQFYDFVNKLKTLNIKIIEVDIDLDLLKALDITYSILSFSEASSNLANLNGIAFGAREEGHNWETIMTNTRSHKFGYLLQRRLTLGAYFLAIENQDKLFIKAQKVRRLIVEEFNRIYQKYDFILSIATPIAPYINKGKDDDIINSYLIHSNFEGSPSIVLPFGKHENMPFGISLDAHQDQDQALLSAALYLETIIGGAHE